MGFSPKAKIRSFDYQNETALYQTMLRTNIVGSFAVHDGCNVNLVSRGKTFINPSRGDGIIFGQGEIHSG